MKLNVKKNATEVLRKNRTKLHFIRSRKPIKSDEMKFKRRDNVGILLDEEDERRYLDKKIDDLKPFIGIMMMKI